MATLWTGSWEPLYWHVCQSTYASQTTAWGCKETLYRLMTGTSLSYLLSSSTVKTFHAVHKPRDSLTAGIEIDSFSSDKEADIGRILTFQGQRVRHWRFVTPKTAPRRTQFFGESRAGLSIWYDADLTASLPLWPFWTLPLYLSARSWLRSDSWL